MRAPEVYLGTLLQEALSAFRPPDTITSAVGGVVSMWLHADGYFTRAVREALRRMRFSPAELDGCRVRQIVQLPFVFKLNK